MLWAIIWFILRIILILIDQLYVIIYFLAVVWKLFKGYLQKKQPALSYD